jgi:AICAR transformylase/IMP cyclohydrolase PurH
LLENIKYADTQHLLPEKLRKGKNETQNENVYNSNNGFSSTLSDSSVHNGDNYSVWSNNVDADNLSVKRFRHH